MTKLTEAIDQLRALREEEDRQRAELAQLVQQTPTPAAHPTEPQTDGTRLRSPLPTICPGDLYGWMFRQSLRETTSKDELALFLMVRVMGSERVAELLGTRRQ